jgi:hypothetical protein
MTDADIASLRESLEAEQSMSFTQELLKARLTYAETPSDDARFTYAFYLLKSASKLDINNAQFHLLELLAANPLNRPYLYHLALAQFKLGEWSRCKRTLDDLAKVPVDDNNSNNNAKNNTDANTNSSSSSSSTLDRKAAALRSECERAQTKERVMGAAFVGVALTGGIGAVVVAGLMASKFLKR